MAISMTGLKEYVDREVRAICAEKGWVCQIRRAWKAREKPVSKSTVEDFEWKLIPKEGRTEGEWAGIYYVLEVHPSQGCFRLLHDTAHCGVWGPHWNMTTYTEIGMDAILNEEHVWHGGSLRDHLLEIIDKYKRRPNYFSIT